MLRLIERTGTSNLGLNFDRGHLFPAGDMPHYVVLALGDRIFSTHFSDNVGFTNAHWRPGRGKIDWKAIFAALQAIGYSGPITLELEDAPGASHWTHLARRRQSSIRRCAAAQAICVTPPPNSTSPFPKGHIHEHRTT